MRINKTIFLAVFLVMLNISDVFADDNPPPPEQSSKTARGGAASRGGEPLPGGPIDENLVYLAIAGLAFGIVMIYKDKIKKASV